MIFNIPHAYQPALLHVNVPTPDNVHSLDIIIIIILLFTIIPTHKLPTAG